jgi:uncharacterized repeat protein (TIGR03803 family)
LNFDPSGNLYGVTRGGGPHSLGTVFQLTPTGSSWTENVLYSFQNGNDGEEPLAALILDGAGNLYGNSSDGGTGGSGTVFTLTPSGTNWLFNVIYPLAGPRGSQQGPWARLLMDKAGNLYGTTRGGGKYGFGTVFKLTPLNGTWTYTSLHDFTGGADGANPYGNVISDSNGNLYGTTAAGGNLTPCSGGCGVVFMITP